MYRILAACLVLTVATAWVPSSSQQKDIDNRLAMAVQSLSLDILYNYVSNNGTTTYITSIPPLISALGEVLPFASGDTYTQLLEIVNLENTEEVKQAFKSQYNNLLKGNGEDGTPQYFGKVYVDDEQPFCKKFTKVVNSYGEFTGTVDYDAPEQATDDINQDIVNQGTKGFDDLVSTSDIDENKGLIFVSALELIVKFNHKLDSKQTPSLSFNSGNFKFIQLPAIILKDKIKYVKIDDYEVYGFKIADTNLLLVVFVPSLPEDIPELLNKLRNPRVFNEAFEKMEDVCFQITFPVIDRKFNVDLGASLQEVRDVSSIYTPGEPEFKGIQKKCSSYIFSNLHESSISKNADEPALEASDDGECSTNFRIAILNRANVYFIVNNADSDTLVPSPLISTVFYG